MDSVCANETPGDLASATEVTNGNAMSDPNHVADAVDSNNIESSKPEQPQTYDDLFPSLPAASSGGPDGARSTPIGEWNKKPMLVSSIVTQVFHIPVEERKDQSSGSGNFGSGSTDDSFKAIKFVMEKTGAKIEMYAPKDQSLTFLITGKQDVVLKARRELLVQFQTQASVSVAIPKDHHKYILGRGGSKLQELEHNTATKISIPKVNEASDKITISGPKEGIDKALHEIRTISDEQSKQSYEVLAVPKIYHPFVSGPNNENIKKFNADHPNVRINIPPLTIMKDELSVAGETEGVRAVKDAIMKIYKDMERKAATVSVEVKKSQHKYVIGPKGNTINEILATTGVFVEMPSSDSPSETITLRGPQEKLGLALTKVYEKSNSVVTYDVSCPNWIHKYIIGKKGANIQKLTCDLPKVHVEFLEAGDVIKIEGPPEEADKAHEMIEAQAKEHLASMSYAIIDVDSKYHKHIIGKGGSTVNKLKQKHTDVMIIIPDNNQADGVIRIEGNKEGVKNAKAELEALVHKMENEREKDLIIENRLHRQMIGPKGENIQKIRDDFASVQISFPDVGSQSDIVKLRGPRDDVEKCSRLLNKIHKDLLESSYQVRVPIFKQFHKFVVGKAGATIKKIRQDTDTKVDLPDSGTDSDVITITGKKANVEKAQELITQIQTEMADVVKIDVMIPSKMHNILIGAGGKLIQSISDDCGGVAIKFPPPDSASDKVSISGPKDDVERAKKMLVDLSNERQLSSMSAEVRAKPEHHKFLIGRQGANIQTIRNKTGAKIIFPGEDDKDREVITIFGTKEAVDAAKKELEARVKDLDKVVEETMTVDPKHHRHFVVRRGEVLRHISDAFGGVIVSFPRSGVTSDKVTLKGAKDCVEGARNRILEIVDDLESQVSIDCIIEQVHHRSVMGLRGNNVRRITADHNVQIKFPEKATKPVNGDVNGNAEEKEATPANDIIKISGRRENCEAASAALKALVPVNIEVNVPFEFHRYIIGQKGAGVRQLMNTYDVNIKVPSSEDQSNVVVITGSPDNVEEARKAVGERVEELEQEKADRELKSFEVKVDVSPEYHPKIIGRKGAVIMQLRQKYDVNIQLPKKDDPDSSTIAITGYEKNANEARDAILKIINEYESMVKEVVTIDHRVHSMIIGRRGIGIRKIMQDYKVDIKLPREGDADPDQVMISGPNEDAVLDCKDHLLNLAEEFEQDVKDKEALEQYLKPSSKNARPNETKAKQDGFKVAKAPWHGASDDAFPTLGNGQSGNAPVVAPAWGPRR